MSRNIENPNWRKEWYEKYQEKYSVWLEQARQRGIKIRKTQTLTKTGDIEDYLGGQLGISSSSIRSWRREMGSSGATYPQDKKILYEVRKLLQVPGTMEHEEWVAASALYNDFIRLLQGSGMAFLWECGGEYSEIFRDQGLYDAFCSWSFMSLEKRCEFLERLKEKYLTPDEVSTLQDFYVKIPSPENCGSKVFEQMCDGEKIRNKALSMLGECQSARETVRKWLERAKAISGLKVTGNKRLGLYYWKLMDEYLEEWLKRIQNQGKIKNFNLLRLALTGYVPISFELKFGWDSADWGQMEREYTCVRAGAVEVTYGTEEHIRKVSVGEYEKIYDWFQAELTAHDSISLSDYLKDRRCTMGQELQKDLQEAENLEEILQEMQKVYGADEYCIAAYSDGSALDRAACVIYESRQYQCSHPNAVRIGFENEKHAKKCRQNYEAAECSAEEKRRFGALYFLQAAFQTFFRFWQQGEKESDTTLFSEELAEQLGEPLLERLVQYMMYLLFDENELAKHLRTIQISMTLREHLLPELSEYMENIHSEVLKLAEEEEEPVLKVILRVKELLE